MKNIIQQLKQKLIKAARAKEADGLLFSGGLDSSILAGINTNLKAITVNLKSYGRDIKHAAIAADFLDMEHHYKSVDVDEVIDAMPKVIKILKTFDLALPNDAAVYFGLRRAIELGLNKVMTGDGADEFFGGYSFMRKTVDLNGYIRMMSPSFQFNSLLIGRFLGIEIVQPFLDERVKSLALKIGANLKIREVGGKICGKWILRKAFEDMLPPEIIWQNKRPLECGSGMTRIRKSISGMISDDEFKEARKKTAVKFINKEHYYYYKIYKKVVGEIPKPSIGEKECFGCGAGMRTGAFHCKICGTCCLPSKK